MYKHELEIPGQPQGKQRPRYAKRTGVVYTPTETKAYEKKVHALWWQSGGETLHGAVRLDVVAYYEVPKSATKAAQMAMLDGTRVPAKKPDIDNVIKIVMDGLSGAAYDDDTQVVWPTGRKVYAAEPCVKIKITEL